MKSKSNFKQFEKKEDYMYMYSICIICIIAYVFPKLQNVKDLVRPLSKKQCLRTSLESQHVKASETIVKSAWEHFYQTFSSHPGEMILKMFRLAKFDILGLFLNTLTADDKYLVWHYERLHFPIQMQHC